MQKTKDCNSWKSKHFIADASSEELVFAGGASSNFMHHHLNKDANTDHLTILRTRRIKAHHKSKILFCNVVITITSTKTTPIKANTTLPRKHFPKMKKGTTPNPRAVSGSPAKNNGDKPTRIYLEASTNGLIIITSKGAYSGLDAYLKPLSDELQKDELRNDVQGLRIFARCPRQAHDGTNKYLMQPTATDQKSWASMQFVHVPNNLEDACK
ncbi:MAG: hypothetical protein ACRDL7_15645 [Gaiellaceae bacterium]